MHDITLPLFVQAPKKSRTDGGDQGDATLEYIAGKDIAGKDIAGEAARRTIEGEIVSLSVHHIAIRRHEPDLGEVVVHFPRLGYVMTAV